MPPSARFFYSIPGGRSVERVLKKFLAVTNCKLRGKTMLNGS